MRLSPPPSNGGREVHRFNNRLRTWYRGKHFCLAVTAQLLAIVCRLANAEPINLAGQHHYYTEQTEQ